MGIHSAKSGGPNSLIVSVPAVYGSGYTDAYSLGGTTAVLNRAVRVVDNLEYEFKNLTFNMPANANTDSSDWTQPANGTYKWSYVYIRPSDNKFFISDNEPSLTNNYRTIGGVNMPYLFTIYTDDDFIYAFTITGSRYAITQNGARIDHYNGAAGLELRAATFSSPTSTTNTDFDMSAKIPKTASIWDGSFNTSAFLRRDSGGSGLTYCYFYIADHGGTLRIIAGNSRQHHVDTPTASGTYYLTDNSGQSSFTVSNDEYDTTSCRIRWIGANGGILAGGDVRNSGRVNLHSFIDRNIF